MTVGHDDGHKWDEAQNEFAPRSEFKVNGEWIHEYLSKEYNRWGQRPNGE